MHIIQIMLVLQNKYTFVEFVECFEGMSYTKEKTCHKFRGLITGNVLSNHLTSPLYNNVFESTTVVI